MYSRYIYYYFGELVVNDYFYFVDVCITIYFMNLLGLFYVFKLYIWSCYWLLNGFYLLMFFFL